MLVLRTPKGLSGPKELHGAIIEGSFRSHQVPLPAAKSSVEELHALQDWLASYKPQELFTEAGAPVETVLSIIPEVNAKKLGQRKEAYANYTPLIMPDWKPLCAQKGSQESCMKAVGKFLRDVIKKYVLISLLKSNNLRGNPKEIQRLSVYSLPTNSSQTNSTPFSKSHPATFNGMKRLAQKEGESSKSFPNTPAKVCYRATLSPGVQASSRLTKPSWASYTP